MTGDELKNARQDLGLTVNQLADILGVDERTIRGWEHGERHGKPYLVPATVELIMTAALEVPAFRKWLGI